MWRSLEHLVQTIGQRVGACLERQEPLDFIARPAAMVPKATPHRLGTTS
jgi:hypothetical protein